MGGTSSPSVLDVKDVSEVMVRLGGVATRKELCGAGVGRRLLDRAVADGRLEHLRWDRYAVAHLAQDRATAHALTGVLSHTSAAVHHGWKVKTLPEGPHVIVRRDRRLRGAPKQGTVLRYRDLSEADVRQGVTTPLRTVLDCARDLPFDEALAIADSALREADVDPQRLRQAAAALRGPGAGRARRVAQHASARATNPFESVLRAIAVECGIAAVPQLQIWEPGLWATVDVGDEALRLALEAESFEFHADRRSLRRDTRRYDLLVVFGWTVLRFTWEHVMVCPAFVRWALTSWLCAQEGHRPPPPPRLPVWHG